MTRATLALTIRDTLCASDIVFHAVELQVNASLLRDTQCHWHKVCHVSRVVDSWVIGSRFLLVQFLERVFEEAERPTLDARVEVAVVLLGALRALIGEALEAGERAGHAAEALET